MEVTEIKHIEDCFDGSLIKELLVKVKISKEQIFALGKDGHLQYFPHFARPFFKIRIPGFYDLKGIEGNNSFRIHLKNPTKYSLEDFIEYMKALD